MFLLTENIYYIWMGHLPAMVACRAGVFLVDKLQDANTLCRHLGW